MKLEVYGKPIALARHRHFKGGTFNPQASLMKRYAWHVVSLLDDKYEPFSQIDLKLKYCFHPPKSWSAKKKKAAIGGPKASKPDLSNLIKFTEDALNGVLWEDDRLIIRIQAEKVYDEWEGTIIEVFNASNHIEEGRTE